MLFFCFRWGTATITLFATAVHTVMQTLFFVARSLDTVCAFGLDLHSVCTYNTLMPLCSNLLLCYFGSLPNYLVLFFYYLSHSVLSLFTLSFIVWFCSLQRLGARQWPCFLDYCGPLNVQQLVLVEATQNAHIQFSHSRAGRSRWVN